MHAVWLVAALQITALVVTIRRAALRVASVIMQCPAMAEALCRHVVAISQH